MPEFLINLITEAMQRKLLHPRSVASESWVSSPTFLRHYTYSQVCTSTNAQRRHATALPATRAQVHFPVTHRTGAVEPTSPFCPNMARTVSAFSMLTDYFSQHMHSTSFTALWSNYKRVPTTCDSTVLNKTHFLWSPALESRCISLHNPPQHHNEIRGLRCDPRTPHAAAALRSQQKRAAAIQGSELHSEWFLL